MPGSSVYIGRPALPYAGSLTPALLQPVHFTPLADTVAAARVNTHGWEARAGNATANARVPTSGELSTFRTAAASQWPGGTGGYLGLVTGNPGARPGGGTWTTDELAQWAAHKWGLPADLLRAQMWRESTWDEAAAGDCDSPGVNCRSFGLTQIKSVNIGGNFIWAGAYPLVKDSSAFNLDFWGAQIRITFDGDQPGLGNTYSSSGASDLWGAVGWWFAGQWKVAGANTYAANTKAVVDSRPWESKAGASDWAAYAGQNDWEH